MICFDRQSGIIPKEALEKLSVTIVGCGAIGSHTAETLAKLGIREMVLWDDDHVEPHNLPNQGFGIPDLGRPKVEIIEHRLSENFAVSVKKRQRRFADQGLESDIVISAVDSMAARKDIWAAAQIGPVSLYIDGRMGAEFGQVFTANPKDMLSRHRYEDTLFSDEEALPAPCTEKATIYGATVLAAMIAAQVKAWAVTSETKPAVNVDMVNMSMWATE